MSVEQSSSQNPPLTANVNKVNLTKKEYTGSPSTLCTGCGHDSITAHIITATYQNGLHPFEVAKMSGIGCSSKTPAYFMSKSFGFNSMHGRMAPVTTGAKVANGNLHMIGMSGDGDTASIGLGGFAHLIRRNLQMTYIVANNGVYGLTKGQFSATADKGAKQKNGAYNPFDTIDICSLALNLGCTFVARSFSGDAKQLVPLIQAAQKHRGTALIDVISPCITFNNHDGSTKSYTYVREHDVSLQELGLIQPMQEIKVDYPEGSTQKVVLPDGSELYLKKLGNHEHTVTDKMAAMKLLHDSAKAGEILTGMFYIDETASNLNEELNLVDAGLVHLNEAQLRPSKDDFNKLMAEFN
ncbi:MAG: 2-oxoacid:ferredoxin oxidoreductase subunit beta [Bdellovibrionaceae bacterium]|nr:2-oxoacid:ferredoxin oxidoreductase subunit beta [Pseudobdellovibrionaceae bacterium]NUM57432.1 2-oxoacid:ferredoxin oxidoreductase subunit beta [Pseudobdellovibrionaceae bacterium]